MPIEIKVASKDEIDIVYSTMVDAFKDYAGKLNPASGALSETTENILNTMNHGGGSVIAWDGLIATGSARFKFIEHYIYIGRVAVLPEYRGKGIGKAMLAFLEKMAEEKNISESRVEVRLSIPDNIEMYKRFS
ncbi:GNAT family N-acetyltransferase [Paenibacillus psychroresistens]|nr:GNAT family N-acetyltransferase [Paenibacillus psychroresistens]